MLQQRKCKTARYQRQAGFSQENNTPSENFSRQKEQASQ